MTHARIRINDKYIDVPEDLQLSFTKKNNLFAFNDIECERSVSFTLPATSINMSVFAYGNHVDISTDITNITSKVAASVEFSGVILDGYLYVNQCDADSFDCVFVFGEDALRLKTIKELGSIKDIVTTDSSVLFGLYQAVNAEKSVDMDIACAWYLSFLDELPQQKPIYRELISGLDALPPFPSVNTRLIAEKAASQLNLKPYVSTANFSNMRLIPNKIEPDTTCALTMKSLVRLGANWPKIVGDFSASEDFTDLFDHIDVTEYLGGTKEYFGSEEEYTGTFNYLAPNFDLILTFPDDFPEDVYLISELKMEKPVNAISEPTPKCKFLGDYSYDFENKKPAGTPLAGRSVNIKTYYTDEDGNIKIDKFMFYKFPDGLTYYGLYGLYFNFSTSKVGTIAAGISVTFTDKGKSLGRVRLQDIYPDTDLVSYYKSIAYVQGDFLTISGGKLRITTPEEIMRVLKYIDVSDRVISHRKSIKRTFGDYAQNNYIAYDSAEYVTDSAVRNYTITNSLLSENKNIYTIPYNYGGVVLVGGLGLYSSSSIALVNKSATESLTKNYTLANISPNLTTFLRRASITANPIIIKLCANALQQSVTLSMPFYLYNLIDEDTILTINGQKWVWLDARYSNGEADFTLQLYE